MTLKEGVTGGVYRVCSADLPLALERRMEALGMTRDCRIEVIHKKRRGTMVIVLRGTRFAIGCGIADRIIVEEDHP